jgi:hypothetical protein
VPRERLETTPYAIRRDIPSEDSGFVNNFMQAISNLGPDDNYSGGLLDDSEIRIPNMISDCTTGRAHLVDDRNLFSYILFMAQGGMVEAMSDLLLG